MGVSPPRKRRPRLLNALHFFEKSVNAPGITVPPDWARACCNFRLTVTAGFNGRQRSYGRVNFPTTDAGLSLEIPDLASATTPVAGGCWTLVPATLDRPPEREVRMQIDECGDAGIAITAVRQLKVLSSAKSPLRCPVPLSPP